MNTISKILVATTWIAFGIFWANVLYANLLNDMGSNVGSWTTLSSSHWNAIVANVQQLNSRTLKSGWEVITLWWRWTAPVGTDLLMTWWGYWPEYWHSNSEPFCLQWGDAGGNAASTNYWDLLYPLGTGDAVRMPPWITDTRHIRCAQVYVPNTTFQLMGTQNCPSGWSPLFTGYSMGGYHGHSGRITKSICIDPSTFDASRTWNWSSGWAFVTGTFLWATSDAANYPTNKWVKCAVCIKN